MRFHDPGGDRFGIPTFPYRLAPDHLATRAQLRALGLRPTADPVAQLAWRGHPARRSGAGYRTAALYHLAHTQLADPPSPGRLAQLAAARARRRLCPACHTLAGYVIPARYGHCLTCEETTPVSLLHPAA